MRRCLVHKNHPHPCPLPAYRERVKELLRASIKILLFVFVLRTLPVLAADLPRLAEQPIFDHGRVKPVDTFARENVRAITGHSTDALTRLVQWVENPQGARAEQALYVPVIALRERLGIASDHISADQLRGDDDFRIFSAEAIRRKAQDKDLSLTAIEQGAIDLRDRLEAFNELLSNAELRGIVGRWRSNQLPIGGTDASRMLRWEVFYNRVAPFEIACAVYLLALMVTIVRKDFGVVILTVAVLIHIAAIVLRCSITGWAPVTNIYETLVWVGLISSILSLGMYAVYRAQLIVITGAVIAAIATILASTIPPQFGSEIRAIPPVLRSNFWLSLHVLTIVSSYAAFAVGMAIGNVILGQYAKRSSPDRIAHNANLLDRAIQVGVVLVAAGTILGGLWADVSWGRFWGWDPKEVWALIILLTYLALLHARHARWLGSFGMAAGSVLAWTTVIMSWYGVNFLLGTGLHSYGFGSGGQTYVFAYLICQWIFVAVVWMIHRRNNKLAACLNRQPQLTTTN